MSKPIDYVAEGEENEALRWRDAEIASLRAKLAAVCRAGETLMLDVDKHSTGAFLSADDLYDAITAAREREE